MALSEPRYTKDLDVWIRPHPRNALRVYKALAEFGAPLSGITAKDFATEGMVFQIGLEPVRIDVLMSIDGVEFEAAWHNRLRMPLGGVECWVIGRADLIRNKRASGRPQDLIDAKALEQSGN